MLSIYSWTSQCSQHACLNYVQCPCNVSMWQCHSNPFLIIIINNNNNVSVAEKSVAVFGDCSHRLRRIKWRNADSSRRCGRGFRRYVITADSIRDSIRIRIVTPDSIRYSIRTQTADSQVPSYNVCLFVLSQDYTADNVSDLRCQTQLLMLVKW